MTHEMLIAGFGGQGIVSLGKLIAYAGMLEGYEVCFWPRYGAEMRGGTAHCTVIISTEMIDSPLVSHFRTLITMNSPSLARFEETVKAGGRLFYNSSLINDKPQRKEIEQVPVDAGRIAAEFGNIKMANIVMLGALSQKAGLFSIDSANEAFEKVFKDMSEKMVRKNQLALQKGAEQINSL